MFESKPLLAQLKRYPGTFECHITVRLDDSNTFQKFESFCKDVNAKAIMIELASGENQSQPMLGKYFQGDPNHILKQIEALCVSTSDQFPLLRLKVEASINNENLPDDDDVVGAMPASCYFEHHIKIVLDKNEDLNHLREVLKTYDGHLSRNPKQTSDTYDIRFITQRFRVGNTNARVGLQRLLDFLEEKNIRHKSIVREFNIFDSKVDFDSGWCDVRN